MNYDHIIKIMAEHMADAIFRASHSDSDRITSKWLMSKHPDLNEQDAEEYRAFCEAHTIFLKGCYGEGKIMWPKWNEFQLEIASL